MVRLEVNQAGTLLSFPRKGGTGSFVPAGRYRIASEFPSPLPKASSVCSGLLEASRAPLRALATARAERFMFIFVLELIRREDEKRHRAGHQRAQDHQSDRRQQPLPKGKVIPDLLQFVLLRSVRPTSRSDFLNHYSARHVLHNWRKRQCANEDQINMRVLIVDDHPVVVTGCRALFTSDPSVEILEASDAKDGHRAYLQKHPDVTVVDVSLPDLTGFELTRRIRRDDPTAKIVMFSVSEDPAFVVRAVEMGIQGHVSKSDDPRLLAKAIRKVAAGERFLSPRLAEATTFAGAAIKASPLTQMSPRELEILRLLGRGDRISEVASELGISYKTVANTTSMLKFKLGAKNHSDLVRIAVEIDLHR
jgi:DNA-binding NarL/FixJ family response regulator